MALFAMVLARAHRVARTPLFTLIEASRSTVRPSRSAKSSRAQRSRSASSTFGELAAPLDIRPDWFRNQAALGRHRPPGSRRRLRTREFEQKYLLDRRVRVAERSEKPYFFCMSSKYPIAASLRSIAATHAHSASVPQDDVDRPPQALDQRADESGAELRSATANSAGTDVPRSAKTS